MKLLLTAVAFLATTGAALACPDASAWGQKVTVSGQDLFTPRNYSVVAGGQYDLSTCGIRPSNWSGAMTGNVIGKPDFSFTMNQLSGYELEFRVVSDCDSVLLVNSATGTWLFDDDGNGNADPKIRMSGAQTEGVYDVWIGTYNGSQCNATLTVESF
ncbi:hypothetical protein [Halocynthiibacter namhaensis]|uniref:hypothetical protein n=1 Tax=Halocynthiibacter namhaensis TaxID=1290553 RepID=UPI0005791E21|nr:hypothetical protein [Halocynthiibacter namhaensis]